MPTKMIRVQIIKPYNGPDETNPITWDNLGKTLRDLRYAASRMANYVIQRLYMYEVFKYQHKEENGEWPKDKEHKDKHECYSALVALFPDVAGNVVNQIEKRAKEVWKARKKEVWKLHQSVPSFKLEHPIIINNQSYSIKTDASGKQRTYIIKANIASKKTERSSYSFLIDAGEKSKQAIMGRLIAGTYKAGALQIVSDRKGKWYCLIPYTFSVEEKKSLDPVKIMGVDLGIAKAVYWAFSDSFKRGWIDGGEITAFREKTRSRRISIQEQGRQCGEGRIGHGRARRLLPVESLQEKESNFSKTTNHRYTRRIIDEALRHGCGVIQIEELGEIREKNGKFLRDWTYADFRTKLMQKADEVGIVIRLIDPQYTSQRCSNCGYIAKENREDQQTFVCKKCGYGALYQCNSCQKTQREEGKCQHCGENTKQMKINADYNAARNLSLAGIAEIITETLRGNSEKGGGDQASMKMANPKRTRKIR